MEFNTLALLVLAVIVLVILIILAITVSGSLESQVGNASGILRL